MTQLPSRPDLAQLRRQAKELHRAGVEGRPDAIRRLRTVSTETTLAAAQLALAREHGFESWVGLRRAVEASALAGSPTPLMAGKYREEAVYRASDFLAGCWPAGGRRGSWT